jgi:mono/diheme cytochrome c family protein
VSNVYFRPAVACLVAVAAAGLVTTVAIRAQSSAQPTVPTGPTVPTAQTAVQTATAPTVWDGVYTEAQAKLGESDFKSYCVECHGEDLAGREQAPALAGPPFLEKWNKATLKKLMETMEGMPPDNPKSLTPKQYTQVMAYILNANEFPAGKTALSEDRSVLSGIQILGVRPGKPAH